MTSTARAAFLQHSETDLPGVLGARARMLGIEVAAFRSDLGPDHLPVPGSFDLLVVMGSVASVLDTSVAWIDTERQLLADTVASGVPVLGVCFGGQLLAQVLGATVHRLDRPEIGWRLLETRDTDRIPEGPWLSWHEDAFSAPPGSEVLARTDVALHAFTVGAHLGLQFHPEVTADIVRLWVHDARAGNRLDEASAAAVMGGFDGTGSGPDSQAFALFDGFLERSGLTV